MDANGGRKPIVRDLIVLELKYTRVQRVVKDGVVVVLGIVVPMAEVVFESHLANRAVWCAAILIVNALRLAYVHISVIPEWKGRVWRDGVSWLGIIRTLTWETLIRELVGALVQTEDLDHRISLDHGIYPGRHLLHSWIRKRLMNHGRIFALGKARLVCRIRHPRCVEHH